MRTGHEELYVVLAGRATFTVDGEEADAPPGTVVFVRDPSLKRAATAAEPATTILSVGAKPGEPYQPMPWEDNRDAIHLFGVGDYAGAKQVMLDALERRPGEAVFLYNLACAEALLGEREEAIEHLVAAAATGGAVRRRGADRRRPRLAQGRPALPHGRELTSNSLLLGPSGSETGPSPGAWHPRLLR